MKHIAIIITLLILDGLILLRLLKTLTRWTFAKIGGQLTHITAGATEGNNYIRQPENLVYTDTRTGKEIAMKRLPALYAVAAILLLHGSAFALGGSGATCNPSTVNWGSCDLVTIPWAASVTNTVNVSGGSWASPYAANAANTKYVLQADATASSAGFVVSADYVIIDLNGHTLTYNQTSAGEGVTIGNWNIDHVAIVNGSIIQGSAMSEGDQYGQGNNPISTYNTALSSARPADYIHAANLYVKYGGRDVGGIICSGENGVYEDNTIEDIYEFGTLKNRHQGIEALTGSKNGATAGNVYRNNTIVNTRQRGIVTGNSAEVYGNNITIRSIATNSVGVSQFGGQNISIHDNTITGIGEHPIGTGAGGDPNGSDHYDIYNNIITLQTTALGEEYGSAYLSDPSATYVGNSAAGIRVTWGGDDINCYNNEITIVTDDRYTGTYSPTGATAYINGGGKGMFIGVYADEVSHYHHNTITVTGDGSYTYGVTCSHSFNEGLYVYNNTITSSQYNIVFGDDYGACNGFPLFRANTLIRSGSNPNYKTYINTYNDTDRHAQVRLVANTYQSGASEETISLKPSDPGYTNVYFGFLDGSDHLYTYRLHDNNGASSTLLREDFDPAEELGYSNPPIPEETTFSLGTVLIGQ